MARDSGVGFVDTAKGSTVILKEERQPRWLKRRPEQRSPEKWEPSADK